jgi:hypothetical protein
MRGHMPFAPRSETHSVGGVDQTFRPPLSSAAQRRTCATPHASLSTLPPACERKRLVYFRLRSAQRRGDFDSAMRRFESSRPSQKINRLANDKADKKGAGHYTATTRLELNWPGMAPPALFRCGITDPNSGVVHDRAGVPQQRWFSGWPVPSVR